MVSEATYKNPDIEAFSAKTGLGVIRIGERTHFLQVNHPGLTSFAFNCPRQLVSIKVDSLTRRFFQSGVTNVEIENDQSDGSFESRFVQKP